MDGQMNGRCKADAVAGSDKSLHIYLYINNARCIGGHLSESQINRQRLEGTGRDERARVRAGAHAFVRRRRWRRVKIYLFKICNGVIVGCRGVALFGQCAGGRPSKQPISRHAGLVGVDWAFDVQTKD